MVELNPEAPEFEWELSQMNPDIEPINKKEVLKAVKKVLRKKKEPVRIDNSPRTTRSGKKFGNNNLILMGILALLTMCITAFGHPCNTTQFKSNPGLFFEKTGEFSLTNDAWNIICHLNMKTYWQQPKVVETMIENLKTVCPHAHPTDHCDVTIEQFQHQLTKLKEKDELINAFSSAKTTR